MVKIQSILIGAAYAGRQRNATEFGFRSVDPDPDAPITCWTCNSARNFQNCENIGKQKICRKDQVCQLTVRERNDNKGVRRIIRVDTGCKQRKACNRNHANNFKGWKQGKDQTQCRPEHKFIHSVCRQCCDYDNCVRDPDWWYPTSRFEWAWE